MGRVILGIFSRPGRLAAVLASVALLAFSGPSSAQQSVPGGFTPEQAEGLQQIIRQYLLNNPEVLIEALREYQQRQRVAKEERQQQAVAAAREALEGDPDSPVLGNSEGDVVLVEFFDYRCPYCRQMAGDLRRIVARDGNVRLVMKELPILGPPSIRAARAALAAQKQGKYAAYHAALMEQPGDMSEPHLNRVAETLGLDVERLRRDMESDEISQMIQRNKDLARLLSIGGTPAFVIGGRVMPGAVSAETLQRLIVDARAGAS